MSSLRSPKSAFIHSLIVSLRPGWWGDDPEESGQQDDVAAGPDQACQWKSDAGHGHQRDESCHRPDDDERDDIDEGAQTRGQHNDAAAQAAPCDDGESDEGGDRTRDEAPCVCVEGKPLAMHSDREGTGDRKGVALWDDQGHQGTNEK